MLILAIESSCDETSLAILQAPDLNTPDSGQSDFEYLSQVKVLASVISSQIEIHKQYGGVVPEVGARRHANQIHFLWQELLDQLTQPELRQEVLLKLDKIMVTTNPGLASALRVGHEFAKSVKFFADQARMLKGVSSEVEIYPINHLRGHMASSLYQTV
ncbi:MAG: hypothetical protein OHK0017_06000 [Patescibacteria group bacterium]